MSTQNFSRRILAPLLLLILSACADSANTSPNDRRDECSTAGISECRQNGFVVCGDLDEDGLLEWGPQQSCPQGQSCREGLCEATCANDCTTPDARECREGGFVTCGNFDTDGCLEWSTLQSCPQGQACVNGLCEGTCEDGCAALGDRQCRGDQFVTCGNYDGDGCLEWSALQSCSPGQSCLNGLCEETCLDECASAQQRECRNSGFVTCGNFDGDSCLEWSAQQSCPQGQSCVEGLCEEPCVDECASPVARKCLDNAFVTCGNFDGDGCLEWSAPQSCPQGESCRDGLCEGACTDDCTTPDARECREGGVVTCGNFDIDDCLEWSQPQSCPAGQVCEGGQCTPPPDQPWRPSPGTSWQWQLTGNIDATFDVDMYDIDLFDTPESLIAALHDQGKVVICYFSAGSREDWRTDADQFPQSAVGNPLDNWPGENWIDTRNQQVRRIMQGRLDLARAKGCDGVEPDNVDGYSNNNGLGLTAADQLDYNRFLAREAHARGLSVGLKNDLDQVKDLIDDFDWALNEECFVWNECERLLPFIEAGKAVFHVEYGDASLASEICPKANELNFDSLVKNIDLDSWRISCR